MPLAGPAAWKATVDMIPDEVPLEPASDRVAAPDLAAMALDWGIAGAMGALAAALVTVGSWILSARRPSRRPESVLAACAIIAAPPRRPGPRNGFGSSFAAIPSRQSASSSAGPAREVTPHDHSSHRRGEIVSTSTSPADDPAAGGPRHAELPLAAISPLRKAAIVLVSLEQSLASQLLAQLDRASVEAVTWEIARLDRIDPAEQAAVLEEFLGLGLRRLCFVFEDLLRMQRSTRSAGPITTRTPPPGRWPSPARPRRSGPRSWGTGRRLGLRAPPDLEGLGPFRLSDAEAAQAEIAERLRLLYDQGAISLPDPSGREEVLV